MEKMKNTYSSAGKLVVSWIKYLQNHRVFKVGRNVWRPHGPTLMLKQGHP